MLVDYTDAIITYSIISKAAIKISKFFLPCFMPAYRTTTLNFTDSTYLIVYEESSTSKVRKGTPRHSRKLADGIGGAGVLYLLIGNVNIK